MIPFLEKPFPFECNPKKEWKLLFLLTLFPGLFFLVFKPFGIFSNAENVKTYLAVFGFGLVTALFAGMFTLLLPLLFKQAYSKFTIGKAILHYSSMIILIAIGNFLYKSYWEDFTDLTWESFFVIFYRTMILAIIPTVLIIVWYQNHMLKRHLQSAQKLNDRLERQQLSSDFFISSMNNKEQLRISSKDLLYVENQDNYVMVYFISKKGMEKKLIRTTLKEIEVQLNDPKLIRCHRSFIVNLNAVNHVKGNSRGLQLELRNMEITIPVSRTYIKKVQQLL